MSAALVTASTVPVGGAPAAAEDIAPAAAGDVAASTLSVSGYWDVCDDAGGAPIDARRVEVADDTDTDELLFVLSSCRQWSASDIGANDLSFYLYVPDGRGDGPDYRVQLLAEAGTLQVVVTATPSDNPATWQITHQGDGEWIEQGWTALAPLPVDAVDGHLRFAWYAAVEDAGDLAGGSADEVPERDEDLLLYPDSCEQFVLRHRLVQAEPGRLGRALAAARAAGFTPRAVLPHAGVFEVEVGAAGRGGLVRSRAALAARAGELAGLDGVAAVRTPAVRRPVGARAATLLAGATARTAAVTTATATAPASATAPATASTGAAQVSVNPDDPGYPVQWALQNIDAPTAWALGTGQGVSIAVIDDGVDASRPDLVGRVDAGWDGVTGLALPAGTNSDRGGHGTAVAGTAAAAGDNGEEIAGVAWEAHVRPYRVFDASSCATTTTVAAAIDRAVTDGVDVINLSLGSPVSDPVEAAAIARAVNAGIVVVAAVGNEGTTDQTTYPAGYDGVVGVGATQRSDAISPFSNRGAFVDVVAPGGDGSGTVDRDVLVLGARDGLEAVAGTSFSAPMVAGAAALYLAVHPQATSLDVATALATSSVDLGATGRDDVYGHGLLDLAGLLAAAPGDTQPVPAARDLDWACPDGAVEEDGFTDVPPDNPHEPAIDCVVWHGIASGAGAGTYGPAQTVRRDQMATFLAGVIEAAGVALPASPPDAFGDDDTSPHEPNINRLAAAGVVSGTGAGTYSPAATVTRAQMATFLARTYEYIADRVLPVGGDWFTDDDGSLHEANIDRIATAGITGGAADGGYRPAEPVRRDQMGSFLARLMDLLVEEGWVPLPS